MDFIFIDELRVEAQVGIYPREKITTQTLDITLTFGVPDEAARDDDIARTIDYAVVIARIRKELAHATQLRKDAEALLAEYKQKRLDAEKEAAAIISTAKAEAEAEEAKLLAEVATGLRIVPAASKLSEYLAWWLQAEAASKFRPSTMARYQAIVDVHYPGIKPALVKAALDAFYEMRNLPGLKKKPSTSELIDWLKLLLAEDIPPESLRSQDKNAAIPPLHGALLKNEQDVHLFERLVFMTRAKCG